MSPQSAVEFFHLLFLAQFSQRVAANLFTLKGGCNLRFFFKSIRYSEDLDLDVQTIAVGTLQSNVRRILSHRALIDNLGSRDIEIVKIAEPKQTATTQRFKIHLRHASSGYNIPTKIEFSRRDSAHCSVTELIDQDVLNRYQLYPIKLPHYDRIEAISQKIAALIGRAETQARDIFDLSFLMTDSTDLRSLRLSRERIERAQSNAQSISFDQFKSQVVSYLEYDYADYYSDADTWKQLLAKVIHRVEQAEDRGS